MKAVRRLSTTFATCSSWLGHLTGRTGYRTAWFLTTSDSSDGARSGHHRSWESGHYDSPQMLETSLPGVFAVGDVRSGNVKRVASAVGEGAIAIHLVHRNLAEL